jgi:hypothetical protein
MKTLRQQLIDTRSALDEEIKEAEPPHPPRNRGDCGYEQVWDYFMGWARLTPPGIAATAALPLTPCKSAIDALICERNRILIGGCFRDWSIFKV